ncbi:MAG TPA: hypothetical protein VLL08_13900 [Kineosporiaceae bacterium]|nr:hypothetical protein [Kineosporiaceae bacterium]
MSQTIVPPAPGGGPQSAVLTGPAGPGGTTPAIGTLGHRLASASATIRHYLDGSPGRLRVVSAVAVLAAVLVALGGGAALRERSGALDEAKRSAAHLVLVQSVQIRLAQANADATNSFLGFGRLEPEAQRLDYIDAVRQASRDLALAASGAGSDAASLGEANAALTRYTGYVASARANNRVFLPVGANYLAQANTLLQKQIVPKLQDSATTDQRNISSAYSRAAHASWWLALVAVIGLGVLFWAQIYLARHSRRILNLPLAAATAGLLVALLVAAGAMATAEYKAKEVRDGSLAEATDLSLSRVAAFTAKSTEALTLIARGSGTEADQDWNAAMKVAVSKLPKANGDAAKALSAYQAEHVAINKSDVAGDWKQAVERAIKSGDTSANALFATYASQTRTALETQSAATASGLDKAGNLLLPAGMLVLLVGLLAAAGAWWGVSLRLDEYR